MDIRSSTSQRQSHVAEPERAAGLLRATFSTIDTDKNSETPLMLMLPLFGQNSQGPVVVKSD